MARRDGVKELLGGQHFLERRSLLFLAPYLVLTSVATILVQSLDQSPLEEQLLEFPWLELVLANVFSILVCWLAIEMLNLTILKNKGSKPVALSLVLSVSFAIGAIKGYTTGIFGFWLDAFDSYQDAAATRWIQGGILGIISLPLLTLTVAQLHRMNQKREILIADHVRGLLSGNIAPTKSLQRQVSDLKARSNELLEKLENSISEGDSQPAAVFESVIQDLLSKHIRPMSHTIWEEKQRRLPKLSIPILLRAGILSPSLNPLISSGLLLLALFMGHLAILSPLESLQRSLAMALTTSLLIRAYGWLRLKSPTIYILGYLITLIGSVALGIALADSLFGIVEGGSFLLVWVLASALALQTMIMATIGKQMITQDRDLDHEIDELVADYEIEDKARAAYSTLVNRDYAQFLHSDVQNQLLISALAARQPNFSSQDLKFEIARLRKLFEDLETERPTPKKISVFEVLEHLEERWEGFIQLDAQVSSQVDSLEYDRSWALIEVLNESISNSIRHGMASRVSITVRFSPDSISVSVEDNGLGVTSGKPGLGSRIIDEITGGNWSLSQVESGGARLTMKLPASPERS